MDDDEENDTFAETMDGLNRAVEWARTHLSEFTDLFSINAAPNSMVEISFNCCFSSNPNRQRAIEALFVGKQVLRSTESSGDSTYKFIDTDAQIAFRWHVYKSHANYDRETETITL
jgi:hypothetical protein